MLNPKKKNTNKKLENNILETPYADIYTHLSKIFPDSIKVEDNIRESFLQETSKTISFFEIYTDLDRLTDPDNNTTKIYKSNIESFYNKEDIIPVIEYDKEDNSRTIFSAKYNANKIKNTEEAKPNTNKLSKRSKEIFASNSQNKYTVTLFSNVKKRTSNKNNSSYSEAKINEIGTYDQLLERINKICKKISSEDLNIGYKLVVKSLIKVFQEGVNKLEEVKLPNNHNLSIEDQEYLKSQIFNLSQLLIHEATRKSCYNNSYNHKLIKKENGQGTILSAEIIMYHVILLLKALDLNYITLDQAIKNNSKYFYPTGTKLRKKEDKTLIIPLFNLWLTIREGEIKNNNISQEVDENGYKQGYTPLKRAQIYEEVKRYTSSEKNNSTPGKKEVYNTPEITKIYSKDKGKETTYINNSDNSIKKKLEL